MSTSGSITTAPSEETRCIGLPKSRLYAVSVFIHGVPINDINITNVNDTESNVFRCWPAAMQGKISRFIWYVACHNMSTIPKQCSGRQLLLYVPFPRKHIRLHTRWLFLPNNSLLQQMKWLPLKCGYGTVFTNGISDHWSDYNLMQIQPKHCIWKWSFSVSFSV